MFQCPDTQLDRSRDELTGLITPIVTPFVSDHGALDEAWVAPHLRFLESHGVDGVLVLGTTGEGPSLGIEERKQMLMLAASQSGTMFVVAGTGCASLSDTIMLSQHALDYGADAIMVMPPFYFKSPTDAGILGYYRALLDALPPYTRLLLYHIPAVTAVPITTAVIDGLLESHPRHVYGIKDSSGDPQHTAMLIERYPQLNIYSGSDSHIATALSLGVAGVISALSNVWPHLVHSILEDYMESGNAETAQERIIQIRQVLPGIALPIALKAAIQWTSDLPRTSVRLPLTNLSETETQRLHAALTALDAIGESHTIP